MEVSHRGQPSGIVTSSAAWWAIVVGREAVLVRTVDVRAFVQAGRFREVQAGDGLQSVVRLVPLDKLMGIRGAKVVRLREGA